MNEKELQKLFRENEYGIKLVQYYEQIDNNQFAYQVHVGGEVTGVQLPALIALNKLYIYLNPDNDHKALEYLTHSLQQINTYICDNIEGEGTDKKFAQQVLKDLEEHEQSFILYRNMKGRHANVIKYSKEDGKYYRTVYNAGANPYDESDKFSIEDKQKLKSYRQKSSSKFPIYSALKYHMQEKYGIGKIIYEDIMESRLSVYRTIGISDEEVKKNNISRLDSISPISDKVVSAQTKGNCSTRCWRECMRHNLPPAEFRNLHDLINNVPYSAMLKAIGIDPKNVPYLSIEELKDRKNQIVNSIEEIENKVSNLQGNPENETEIPLQVKPILALQAEACQIQNLFDIAAKGIGYTREGKNILVTTQAQEFSAGWTKLHEGSKELIKELYPKIFEKGVEDIDLVLLRDSSTILVEKVLVRIILNVMLKEDRLDKKNFNWPNILPIWQMECINSPDIDLRMKAIILAGMSKEQRKELNFINTYPDNATPSEIYQILRRDAKLRNDLKPIESSMKENFPKVKDYLAKNLKPKTFREIEQEKSKTMQSKSLSQGL